MKTMKTLKTILLTVLAANLLIACSLVELDSPGPTEAVDAPNGFPALEADFMAALTGDEGRTWNALTFELEGLDGFQLCRLDDTFTFFPNGTYRYDGGEVLCGGADDRQIKTGVWELDFGRRQLVFDEGTSLEYTAIVAGLEDNRIQLNGQVDIFGTFMDIEGIYETTN